MHTMRDTFSPSVISASAAMRRPTRRALRLNRLSWLLALYEENYHHLNQLFAPHTLAVGRYLSDIGDGLDLRLDIIRQHRYTTELQLTYDQPDAATGLSDPSAWLRLYRDARQAEITHCYAGRGWQDILGPHPPSVQLLHYRLHINTFLGKWLDYLRAQGHGCQSLVFSADILPK